MRGLDSEISTTQDDASYTPYVRIYLPNYEGGVDLSEFAKEVVHLEQPMGGSAQILLGDAESWFVIDGNPIDIKGEKLSLGYGFEVSSVKYWSTTGPLWIQNARLLSSQGVLNVQLECFDIWQRIRLTHFIAPKEWRDRTGEDPAGEDTRKTLWGILQEVFEDYLSDINIYLDASDGIVDNEDYKPSLSGFTAKTSIMDIISNCLALCSSGMRMRDDGMHVFPLPKTNEVSASFNGTYKMFSEVWDDELALPNRVIVVPELPDVGEEYDPETSGVSVDSRTYERMGYYVTRLYEYPGISKAEADSAADAIMAKNLGSVSRGVVNVPHHCGIELYDVVKVYDPRW